MRLLLVVLALCCTLIGLAHADNAFSTLLTPDLEPLGGAVGKRGTVTFSLASATAILSYSITHDVTDATAIHLHDLNTGGVLYTWAATPAAAMALPITGTVTLNDIDRNLLILGKLYVNIHSTAFPGGAIRGTLIMTGNHFSISLAGANEVAAGDSNHKGTLTCVWDGQDLYYSLMHDMFDATATHLHLGKPGVQGPVIWNIATDATAANLVPITGNNRLSGTNLEALYTGDIYVNVHNNVYPAGAIRGQLSMSGIRITANFTRTSTNAVDAGTFSAVWDNRGSTLYYILRHNVADSTEIHIHSNKDSSILQTIAATPTDSVNGVSGQLVLTPAQHMLMLEGEIYVVVHSTAFPSGALRLTIPLPNTLRFMVPITGIQACDANGASTCDLTKVGSISAVYYPKMKQLFMATTHNVVAATTITVNTGAYGAVGSIAFTIAHTPAAAVSIPILSEWAMTDAQVTSLLNGDLYVNIPATGKTLGAIRGQLLLPGAAHVVNLNSVNCVSLCDPASNGTFIFRFEPQTKLMVWALTHNVPLVNGIHIHTAPPGITGPHALDIVVPTAIGASKLLLNGEWTLTNADFVNLVKGSLYINLHTASYPLGISRGNIKLSGNSFMVKVDAASVPTPGSTATQTGTLYAVWDGKAAPNAGQLTYALEHNVADVTGVNLHVGLPGVAGPSFALLSSPTNLASPVVGGVVFTAAEADDLLSNKVNIVLTNPPFPAGAVRGQLTLNGEAFTVQLTAAATVPVQTTLPTAAATLNCVLDANAMVLYFSAQLTSLPLAELVISISHGANGVAATGTELNKYSIFRTDNGEIKLDAQALYWLLSGDLYVVIGIASHPLPGGAARGQFAMTGNLFTINMTPEKCVPTRTAALQGGTLMGSWNPLTQHLIYSVTHNITTATNIVIAKGLMTENGATQFSLPATMKAGLPVATGGSVLLSDMQSLDLFRGGLYACITDPTFPSNSGVVRGQFVLAGNYGHAMLSGRNNVSPGDMTRTGRIDFYFEKTDAYRFYYVLQHDVMDATLIHFHDGAVGVSGPVLFTLASSAAKASKPVIVGSYVTPTADIAALIKSNFYVNIHTGKFASGAIRADMSLSGNHISQPLADKVGGTRTGSFDAVYDGASQLLTYAVQHSTLSSKVALASVAADVVLLETIALGVITPVVGQVKLNTAAQALLFTNNLFLNVRNQNAAGALTLQGLLRMSGNHFSVMLTGKKVSPANGYSKTATLDCVYEGESQNLFYVLTHTDTNATAIYLYPTISAASTAPKIIIAGNAVDAVKPVISGMFTLTAVDASALIKGAVWAQVFDTQFPGGAMAGVLMLSGNHFMVTIDQAQEVPGPGQAGATGAMHAFYDAIDNVLTFTLTHNIGDATAIHIHQGGVGTAGNILLTLAETSAEAVAIPITGIVTLTSVQVVDLFRRKMYVNIHSSSQPGGAARGQMSLSGSFNTVELLGTNEIALGNTTGAIGYLSLVWYDHHLYYSLEHNVFDATNIEIFRGAPGTEGALLETIATGAAATTPKVAGLLLWDRSVAFATDLMKGELYMNIKNAKFPTGAIRGQMALRGDKFSSSITGPLVLPLAGEVVASGTFYGVWDFNEATLFYAVTHNLIEADVTQARLMKGATNSFGVYAPVVVQGDAPMLSQDSGHMKFPQGSLQDALITFKSIFYQVDNKAFPGGALRANIQGASTPSTVGTTPVTPPTVPVCTTSEFLCKDNSKCVANSFKCDSYNDCADKSDELACSCNAQTQFTCAVGGCQRIAAKCDGKKDCSDNSDEFGCNICSAAICTTGYIVKVPLPVTACMNTPCATSECCTATCDQTTQFTCAGDKACISLTNKCDGFKNCADNSDEWGCPLVACSAITQFTCYGDKSCIPLAYKCDGQKHCQDNSDEWSCPLTFTCQPGQFKCYGENVCIPWQQKCDQVKHCADNSDEWACAYCLSTQYTCYDKSCAKGNARCDFIQDCPDNSDEWACPLAPVIMPFCKLSDCPAGSSVRPVMLATTRCSTNPCTVSECCTVNPACSAAACPLGFTPKSPLPVGSCLSSTCSPSECCTISPGCNLNLQFTCVTSRVCIPKSNRCDGIVHCADTSDEINCPLPNCSTKNVCTTAGLFRDTSKQPVACAGPLCTTQECCTTVPPTPCLGAIQFTCVGDGSCIAKDYRCDGLIQCSDNSDEWGCAYHNCMNRDVCGPAGQYRDVQKNPSYCPLFFCTAPECCTTVPPAACSPIQFTCVGDKSCVPIDYRCDGTQHCSDNSDEWACPYHNCMNRDVCGPNQLFRNKALTPAYCPGFLCNPSECCTALQPPPCAANEFTCVGDKSCVPLASKCTQTKECSDNSDEWNCPWHDCNFSAYNKDVCTPFGLQKKPAALLPAFCPDFFCTTADCCIL